MRSEWGNIKGIVDFRLAVLIISIVIDSDRGHCYEYLKKKNYDENLAGDMYLNVCVCDKF